MGRARNEAPAALKGRRALTRHARKAGASQRSTYWPGMPYAEYVSEMGLSMLRRQLSRLRGEPLTDPASCMRRSQSIYKGRRRSGRVGVDGAAASGTIVVFQTEHDAVRGQWIPPFPYPHSQHRIPFADVKPQSLLLKSKGGLAAAPRCGLLPWVQLNRGSRTSGYQFQSRRWPGGPSFLL